MLINLAFRRRQLAVSIALVFVLAGPAIGTQAASGPPSPPSTSKPVGPAASLDRPGLSVQTPADLAANALDVAAHRGGLVGFTGVAIKPDSGVVILYWHGEVPSAIIDLVRQQSQSVTIRVQQAPYSESQLLNEARRLIDSGPGAGGPGTLGTAIIRAGILPDFSGLEVTFDQTVKPIVTPEMIAEAASTVRTTIGTGSPMHLFAQYCPPFSCPPGGRWSDSPAYWGGDAITDGNGNYCTTSWMANHNGDNIVGLLTAAHCANFGVNYYDPGLGGYVGQTAGNTTCCFTSDTTPVTQSHTRSYNEYGPYIYVGSYSSPSYTHVGGQTSNPVNAQRCFSGSWSGEVCGSVIVSGLEYYNDFGYKGLGVWTEQPNHVTGAAGQGDSGGPMYLFNSSGDVVAAGEIYGTDSATYTCTGIQQGRLCSWRIFAIDVGSALSSISATLVT
jgi:hypothetical protein